MSIYLLLNNLNISLKKYIINILLIIIFFSLPLNKSHSEENVFTINDVKVKGTINLNFSREKYLNKAFSKSFKILMNRILLTRDLNKVENVKLKTIKKLIISFQIIEENYNKDLYKINIKVTYNENKLKDFLSKKNISFAKSEKITVVFFPLLYKNNIMQDFSENFFYKNWNKVKIENEVINFILPIEDLEDILKITKMKNNLEDLKIDSLVNKYNVDNYVFAMMDYNKNNFKIYLKINFNNNKITKNILYKSKDISDDFILRDLKLKINDLWKEENLVNLLMPLSISVKFEHKNLKDLDILENSFNKISIIKNFSLEEFNINNSFYKLYYYGNPIKLKIALQSFGYKLRNDQGKWQVYLNE